MTRGFFSLHDISPRTLRATTRPGSSSRANMPHGSCQFQKTRPQTTAQQLFHTPIQHKHGKTGRPGAPWSPVSSAERYSSSMLWATTSLMERSDAACALALSPKLGGASAKTYPTTRATTHRHAHMFAPSPQYVLVGSLEGCSVARNFSSISRWSEEKSWHRNLVLKKHDSCISKPFKGSSCAYEPQPSHVL